LVQAAAEGHFEEAGWRIRKDGSRFWADVLITPLHDEKNELRGFSKIVRDITARRTAEELLTQKLKELARSNKDLEQFSYVASHDLQEPLRMVASYMQLLSRRYKGKLDADADDFIAFAVDGTTRMQALIRDLLAYSRVGTGDVKLGEISSEKSLQAALFNLRGSIEASGALVTHDPLPTVMGNEMLLSQLFQNLVSNAIKYQTSGIPKVHISAARNGRQQWSFSVQDNGIGIESQNFERVFGMFQRLHKGGEFSGTGIGLAICKKIVEQHHGNISVESQPGKGSTFHFTLAQATASPLEPA
jgi:light-regulated signal transduction histidine kinase (bacteriophytochrome)